MIGIGFCGRWHFLFACQTSGACQVTGQSVRRAQTSCVAKLHHITLLPLMWLIQKKNKKPGRSEDVYKITFSHVHLSGDTFLAPLQSAPRVWNLNSSSASEGELACTAIDLLHQYQYKSIKRRGTTAYPHLPILQSFACVTCRPTLRLMQKHAWILCSISLGTAWIWCVQFSHGLHEY